MREPEYNERDARPHGQTEEEIHADAAAEQLLPYFDESSSFLPRGCPRLRIIEGGKA